MPKSFFEKLVVDSNQGGENENNDEIKENEDVIEQEDAELAVQPDPEPEVEAKLAVASKVKTRATPKEEDITDEEGALTVDVFQTASEIIIKSTVAGVKPEDIDVAINNDMVTIKGSREKEEEVDSDDYYYQELYWGTFSRSVILPAEVDPDGAVASLKNGILTIRLPKISRSKDKKLKISVE